MLKLVLDFIASVPAIALFGVAVPLAAWLGRLWSVRITNQELETLRSSLKLESDQVVETLRSVLSKGALVHRVQFEKEFAIYVELWSELVECRRAAHQARPMAVMDQSAVAQKNERLTVLVNAHNKFLSTVAKHQPFIAPKVYETCNEFLNVASEEHNAVKYGDAAPQNDAYWAESQVNAKRITDLESAVCEEIRRRINIMNVESDATQRSNPLT